MKHIFILIMALMVAACGHEGPDIDTDLQASVDRYLSIAPNKGHWDQMISIDWGETNGKSGHCHVYGNRFRQMERKIRINPNLKGKGALLDTVVAHELGHCLHDKEHADTGIMQANIFPMDSDYWDIHYTDDLKALFN